MKTQEYYTIDKSQWRDGPWKNEPDKIQWRDEETGLACLIVRQSFSGHLCGYVGITKEHPFFGDGYSDRYDLQVHGGLTFSSFCDPNATEEEGICHTVEEGEDDKVWWFGFDCYHLGDFAPMDKYGEKDTSRYKNIEYVRAEVKNLARQLSEHIKQQG